MYNLSDDFKKLVTDRIRETLPQQRLVYKSISEGRPLDGEDDIQRKIAFIKRKVGVSSVIAKRIADYEDVATLNLTDNRRTKAESIQGSAVDFTGICFLDLARAASRSVARVVHGDNEMPQGTGFMISSSLFLTNQHVIKDENDAPNFILEFNYEQDFKQNILAKTRFRLAPDQFFVSSPQKELDYSVMAIGEKIDGPLELSDIGFLPLFDNDDKQVKALFVNCIEHPEGVSKQLAIRENRLTAQTINTLIYNSDTRPGSSGSPIFNDDWEVLALHHYGSPYKAILDPHDTAGLPANGNEGIRISSIVQDLNKKIAGLPPMQASLLREALSHNFRQPSLMAGGNNKESLQNSSLQKGKTGVPAGELSISQAAGTVVNIPATISFTLPLPVALNLTNSLLSSATLAFQNNEFATSSGNGKR